MIDRGKHSVLGVNISAVDYQRAVANIIEAAEEGVPFSCSALAVHGVMTGAQDAEHLYRLNGLDMAVPDGQPVRWALRVLHGVNLPDRVYGPRLMLETCAEAERKGLPIYLFGSSPAVLGALSENLTHRFPELKIAGQSASRFRTLSAEEAEDLVETIHSSRAALVFAGLGCPRQEVWAYEFTPRLGLPVIAIGAAFDFHAGNKATAPAWMQRIGLEWLFRLFEEPRRLWKRYLLLNPAFLARLAIQRIFPSREIASRRPTTEVLYG